MRESNHRSSRRISELACNVCPNNCLIKEIRDSVHLDDASRLKSVNSYSKGQLIFKENAHADYISFVNSGKLKIYKYGYSDNVKILRFTNAGELLGHRGINMKFFPISAQAIDDCVICSFTKEDFFGIVQRNRDLAFKLIMLMADELNNSELRERNMAEMTVPQKIADTLIYLSTVFGINEERHLNIFLTRLEIAQYAGTTREQVSKYLSDFHKEGIILVRTKHIQILDPLKLQEIASLSNAISL